MGRCCVVSCMVVDGRRRRRPENRLPPRAPMRWAHRYTSLVEQHYRAQRHSAALPAVQKHLSALTCTARVGRVGSRCQWHCRSDKSLTARLSLCRTKERQPCPRSSARSPPQARTTCRGEPAAVRPQGAPLTTTAVGSAPGTDHTEGTPPTKGPRLPHRSPRPWAPAHSSMAPHRPHQPRPHRATT